MYLNHLVLMWTTGIHSPEGRYVLSAVLYISSIRKLRCGYGHDDELPLKGRCYSLLLCNNNYCHCQVFDLMPGLIIRLHLLISIFIGMTETF